MINRPRKNQLVSDNDLIAAALKTCRSALVSVGAMSLVINILTLTAPIFMMQVSDRVLSSQSVPTLVVIGALALGLYIFFGFLDYLRTRVVGRISLNIEAQLSGTAFEICTLLPSKLGEKSKNHNPMNDLEVVRQFVSGPGPSTIFDLPWLPLYLFIVYLFHPMLGTMAAAGAACILLLIALNEILSRHPTARLGQATNDRARFLEECRHSSEAVHSMGMVGALRQKWTRSNSGFMTTHLKSHDIANLFGTLIKTFRFIMQSAILGGGAWLVINGQSTIGVMIAASIITARSLAPVEQAVGYWRSFIAARQSLQRLRKSIGQWKIEAIETELSAPQTRLSLENLATASVGMTTPYVRNVSFELKAGEAIGIIGQAGSGKTCLVRAILGINPVFAGSVRLDGSELDQWSTQARGEFIGYLPQEVQLLNGTIAQNICRFDPEAKSEDIIGAAQLSGIHDMVAQMPGGYDALVGEHGQLLSGGQRQRIGLARALFRNPFLVILDEPNSNLDAEGEVALTDAINHLKQQGCAVIVVAHRAAALHAMDQILVMEKGQIKAIGPKQDILKKLIKPVIRKAG